MSIRRWVKRLLQGWEAIQVELQGHTSVDRVRAIVDYSASTGYLGVVGTMLLTPLPSVLLAVVMDALPLNPPHAGLWQQTPWVPFRLSFTASLVTFIVILQMRQSSPTLTLTHVQLWAITILSGLTCLPTYYVFGLTVGFPTPFLVQLATVVWFLCFPTMILLTWRKAFREDPTAGTNLKRYLRVFVAQVYIVITCIAINILFNNVEPPYQQYVSMLLPLIKLVFKNAARGGVLHMEDLAPLVLAWNFDVFHSFQVSSSVQQAKELGTLGVIMAVDFVQSAIAYFEISKLIKEARWLAQSTQRYRSGVASRLFSANALRAGAIRHVLENLEENPRLRTCVDASEIRTARGVKRSTSVQAQYLPSKRECAVVAVTSAQGPPEPPSPDTLTAEGQAQVACAKSVLRLMHMVEFYMLIEFAEVMVAVAYTVYLLLLSFLPNRVYYIQLRTLTDAELRQSIARLAVYAAMELLSLLIISGLLDRVLHDVATLKLIGFVLSNHRVQVFATLVMWFFFMVQLTFEHFGADFDLKFSWLKG